MSIYVGTSGYAYKEWKGKFYPEKTSPKDMLRLYSERLRAVEINNTFYRMPKRSVLESWAEQVPDGFVFAIKAPQVITHIHRLNNVGDETDYFLGTLSALGGKLGPVLFQFPKSFRANRTALEDLLNLIPDDIPCAFEFRNRSWFDDAILDLLRQKKCSLCTADTEEEPANEIIQTAPWGYLRLRRPDYTDADLMQWAERVRSQGWERAYVFFKHEEEAKGPRNAVRFREIIESS